MPATFTVWHLNKGSDATENESDDKGAEAEIAFSSLREEVLVNIQPAHPIMGQHKLLMFTISMLNRIRLHFEIPTCDIKEQRGAPHLNQIEDLLNVAAINHKILFFTGAGFSIH